MKTYKIIIDGNEVDLYDPNNLDIAITLAISDSNDLTTRKAGNTKTIKVPATATNKQIFGHPQDFNSVVEIDQTSKPSAVIEASGTRIFNGFAKPNGSTDIATNNITEYELNCIGDNGDWVSKVSGKKLSDLDYSDQNHYRTAAVQNASETIIAGREYVYDLIDRGEFAGQLYYSGTLQKRSVNISDRYPALSIKSMIDRTINATGYKIVSSFMDGAFFKSLYWQFTNERLNIDQSFKDNLVCQIQSLHPNQYIAPNTTQKVIDIEDYYADGNDIYYLNYTPGVPSVPNPSGAYGLANPYEYFVKASGKYKIQGQLSGTYIYTSTASITSANIFFNIMKKNRFKDGIARSIYFKSFDAGDRVHGSGLPYGTFNFFGDVSTEDADFAYTWGEFDLEYGDEIYYEITTPENFQVYIGHVVFGVPKITNIYGIGEGQLFDFNLNMPIDSQLDFIQGLKELFNLHFSTDVESRIIYIEPYDDFYNGEIEDWSSKLDRSRDVKINFTGSNLSRTIRYRYKNDSNDKFVDQWQKDNAAYLGEQKSELSNVFAKDEIQEITNKIFCPTWMNTCARIGLNTSDIPRMWCDVSIPKHTTKFGARILVYQGVKEISGSDTSWRMNPVGTMTYQNANPTVGVRTDFPSFIFYDNSQVNDNNLMYCDSHYSHGLHQKFYRNNQKIIDDGRQYIPYLKLNDLDISNLDFRKKKYIEEEGNGSYFILDKIDNYKSQDNVSTLSILTKVLSSVKLSKLPYQLGQTLIIPNPPKNNLALSISEDGAIQVRGQDVLTPTHDGEYVSGNGNVFTEQDGIIQPVYYIDSLGNYQIVKNG